MMDKVFSLENLLGESQTVKTIDGKIWINMCDGRFLQKESVNKQKFVFKSVQSLYVEAVCVTYNGNIIARRKKDLKYLRRLKNPKRIAKLQ